MHTLIPLLHTGKFSCVIRKGMEVRTFTQRGVADLYALLTTEPDFLKGSSIADKVIGKGAAALMIQGGVKKVYADVISRPALVLLQSYHMDVQYATLTDNIINRAGTGICPVEQRCLPLEKLEDMVEAIGDFVEGLKRQ
jgi:iron complex outermembrane receptor protein